MMMMVMVMRMMMMRMRMMVNGSRDTPSGTEVYSLAGRMVSQSSSTTAQASCR
jgi:hypothetical protein